MSNELISKLKPKVTTFSEAIRYNFKHSDPLCVGGVITNIFDMSILTDDKKLTDGMVQMTIDDNVGKMLLLIPKEGFDILNKEYSFKNGMVVLAEGKLLDFEKELYKPNSSKSINYDTPAATLICWVVKPYKETEESDS
jgi:hypothetical protein